MGESGDVVAPKSRRYDAEGLMLHLRRDAEILRKDPAAIVTTSDELLALYCSPAKQRSLITYYAHRCLTPEEHALRKRSLRSRGGTLAQQSFAKRHGEERRLERLATILVDARKLVSPAERRAAGRRGLQRQSEGFMHHGFRFRSSDEAVAASMLEKYIAGYELAERVTRQVHLEHDGRYIVADFYLPIRPVGVLFDYHKIVTKFNGPYHGDFDSPEEYELFAVERAKLSQSARRDLERDVSLMLLERYRSRRQTFVDGSGIEALYAVALDSKTMFDAVIEPYGTNIPRRTEFCRRFDMLRRRMKAYGTSTD